jgi:HPt (histidine-containing phosphotransfer) domain-containing protein
VLLAEGHPVHRSILCRLLEREGHCVVAVGEARAALERLGAAPFDVVMIDLRLPGGERAAVVRAARRNDGVRVIGLVGDDAPDSEAGEPGCDLLVRKPVRREAIAAALRPPPRCVGPVDLDEALARAGGSESLLREIAAMLVDSAPRDLAALEQALAAADATRLARGAHSMKGTLGTFGAAAAVAEALELELAAKAQDLVRASAALERLREHVDAVVGALAHLGATAESAR